MNLHREKTLWPVMITPFKQTGKIDYYALEKLIDWYEQNGVDGLFAVCQSSEMFFLSLKERVELAAFVKKKANVPVVASGHISYNLDDQVEEIKYMYDTGIEAVILITNRFCSCGDPSEIWIDNLDYVINKLDENIPLGLYECPYPYKHLLTNQQIDYCAKTERFLFLKDTCCDIDVISDRIKILEGTNMNLYNANSATLLKSINSGAAGFSGVMANFHPELYSWLMDNWENENAEYVQAVLTVCSFIERQLYPINAKYHMKYIGLPVSIYTRSKNHNNFTDLFKDEVEQTDILVKKVKYELGIK